MFGRIRRSRHGAVASSTRAQQTPTTDDRAQPLDRRGVLRLGGMAAAGAAGAAIATAVNAAPADAANGDPLVLGMSTNASSAPTELLYNSGPDLQPTAFGFGVVDQSAPNDWASGSPAIGGLANGVNFDSGIYGKGAGDTLGVVGESDAGYGVFGTSQTGFGVWGSSPSGAGVFGSGPLFGVAGTSRVGPAVSAVVHQHTNSSPALQASSNGYGGAVLAETTYFNCKNPAVTATSGVAALPAVQANGAASGTGAALDVHGKAAFTRSNVLNIAGTNNKLTGVIPGGLTATSHVLATLQTNSGTLAVRAAVPILTGANAGKIQIFLTGNAPAAPGVNVAWFVFG